MVQKNFLFNKPKGFWDRAYVDMTTLGGIQNPFSLTNQRGFGTGLKMTGLLLGWSKKTFLFNKPKGFWDRA